MEKEFTTYEQALVLKELGFDEPCFGYYVDGELRGINLGMEELGGIKPYYQKFGFHTLSNHDIDNPSKIVITAPLYQQAFRWFREKYKLDSWVYKSRDYAYFYSILRDSRYLSPSIEFKTYEEAELECLKKLIEIVKEK
jgi:hypothetical protein